MFALGEYPTVKPAESRDKCEQARKIGIFPFKGKMNKI
jgi:hypothetical protein